MKKGFTFIELMVVITIVFVLVVVSIPTFREFTHGRRLHAAGNTVISSLRRARTEAITKRKNHKSVIDTINWAVAIYDNDNALVDKWKNLPDFVTCDISRSTFSSNDGSYYYMVFKPNGGLAEILNQGKVFLQEESTKDTSTITVNALTGRIE